MSLGVEMIPNSVSVGQIINNLVIVGITLMAVMVLELISKIYLEWGYIPPLTHQEYD